MPHLFSEAPRKGYLTRFNFNMLFSQAWLKSLIPSNIIAGFKTSGIFPYIHLPFLFQLMTLAVTKMIVNLMNKTMMRKNCHMAVMGSVQCHQVKQH